MKKKLLALLLVLLLIPAVTVRAAGTGWAESLMEDIYVVIGGGQSITVRSHVESGGKGGYCQALYACELTGSESKAELDAMAAALVESGAKPAWGGSKPCFHGGNYIAEPECTLTASELAPGSYLYVCYAFGCDGSYNHNRTNYFEQVSTMALRVTKEAEGLDLQYILLDETGTQTGVMTAGGEGVLALDGGPVRLELRSRVEYPVERVVDIRADFSKNLTVEPFGFDGRVLEPVCCGSGSITVTIGNYLDDTIRTETVFIEVPCAPMEEATVLTEPTCTEEGLAVYLCRGHGINCETAFDEVVLSPTGHTLSAVEGYVLEPTATLPGIGLGKCGTCGMENAEQALPPVFSDTVADSFYGPALDYCYDAGWVNGVRADQFAPGSACVRAQVVTFLWRAAGCPEPADVENPFEDVAEDAFYYDAVLWAVEKGITTGTDSSHFSPLAVCNRAQVVTFLWRAFGQPEPEAGEQPFADVQAGSWYEQPVFWAVAEGITSGMTATTFGPTADCNRAQIVTFLYRAYAE